MATPLKRIKNAPITKGGLTDKEYAEWCKDKSEFYHYHYQRTHTKAEKKEWQRKAEEYRDWQRRQKIQQGAIHFNPKIHTSKIFSDLPGYTGGEDE